MNIKKTIFLGWCLVVFCIIIYGTVFDQEWSADFNLGAACIIVAWWFEDIANLK